MTQVQDTFDRPWRRHRTERSATRSAVALWYLERVFWIMFLLLGFGGLAMTPLNAAASSMWLLADAIAALCFLLQPRLYQQLIVKTWPLWTWVIVATLSAAWSLTPGLSAYHGVQLGMTFLVGIVLGYRFRLKELLQILFFALVPALLLSLVFVFVFRAVDPVGAWMGTFPHKNNLAGTMVILFYTSAVLYLEGWRRWWTGPTAVLAVITIYFTRSGTSSLLVVVVLFSFLLLQARRLAPTTRATIGCIGLMLLCSAVLASSIRPEDIFGKILEALGKDSSLTGRTVLWDYGWRSFLDNPYLGIGFKAYFGSNQSSSLLVQFILEQELPYLHNNFLEVAVATGIFGFVFFIAGLIYAGWRIFVAAFYSDEPCVAWIFLLFTTVLVTCISENPLFYNHSLQQAFLLSAVTVTYRIAATAKSSRAVAT